MESANIEVMRSIFSWFNQLANPSTILKRSDVERFFTAEALMITNGVAKCQGTEAFVKHFEEIRSKLRWFEVQPIQSWLASAEAISAVYDIDFTLASPEASPGKLCAHVLWRIEDGRVALLREWVYSVGAPIEFDVINE